MKWEQFFSVYRMHKSKNCGKQNNQYTNVGVENNLQN